MEPQDIEDLRQELKDDLEAAGKRFNDADMASPDDMRVWPQELLAEYEAAEACHELAKKALAKFEEEHGIK